MNQLESQLQCQINLIEDRKKVTTLGEEVVRRGEKEDEVDWSSYFSKGSNVFKEGPSSVSLLDVTIVPTNPIAIPAIPM